MLLPFRYLLRIRLRAALVGERYVPDFIDAGFASPSSGVLSMPPEFDIITERFSPGKLFAPGFLCAGVAASPGTMYVVGFDNLAWLAPVTPLHFGVPITDSFLVLTLPLGMIVSIGVFTAFSEMRDKSIRRPALRAGVRTAVHAASALPETQS